MNAPDSLCHFVHFDHFSFYSMSNDFASNTMCITNCSVTDNNQIHNPSIVRDSLIIPFNVCIFKLVKSVYIFFLLSPLISVLVNNCGLNFSSDSFACCVY